MSDSKWSVEDAEATYHVSKWGNGYFGIGEDGCLTVNPNGKEATQSFAIKEVIEEMKTMGVQFPTVIRFHDILRSQVKHINKVFRDVIEEADYEGRFLGVYPVKVNQMREVVEEIVDAGAKFDYGLEAGSKPELLSVLAYNNNKNSLTVLNGYKDEEYLRLAMIGRKLKRKVVVVIEKFSELKPLVEISRQMGVEPMIGIRAKMTVKGRGKWESSSGDRAKFGLTTAEILRAIQFLRAEGLDHCIKLFHFHIGSQITDIRSIKEAIQEGGRIYAKLHQMNVPIEYFDVGGGLGVDYDGSKTTNESSTNYSIVEYVSDIVYGLKQICDIEAVPHPNIVTESGRAITAHHSCLVTNVVGEIDNTAETLDTKRTTGEHILVTNMRDLEENIDQLSSLQEAYNDAIQIKDDVNNGFKLGVITLEERAKSETLYWRVLKKINDKLDDQEFVPEDLQGLDELLSAQYLCNFSVFQSAADSWAIDQLLPICPISRLDEKPTKNASLVDITCDSDGKIDKFIDLEGERKTIPIHKLKSDEPYYLGIFLTGAYQDVMGDMHNLFGRLNEVHVYSHEEDPKKFYIEEVIKGSSAELVLSTMQYNPQFMAFTVKKAIDKEVVRGSINPREGVRLIDFYEDCLAGYTYLKTSDNKK
ncbi:biosynthetic arginine decarboxylase [Halobacteriovorax sp. GB3]|uniref:biosynthetic arginine decarboxylase n=1 Tax=Halobacteriovorax sp. GB3 TaxID=2719615 RepID=UPI00235E7153|nr:biosynthetic arginine decarboxylase [Halobacteriovorax sp. GB3]MDD0853216.1 biosynthetic arginine decarboxylase [Halobacteriovorax sp. GB3]